MSHVHGIRLGNRGATLWWIGWHPLVTPLVGAAIGLIVGNAVAIPLGMLLGINVIVTMAGGIVVGLSAGIVTWYRGTRAVNERYGEVLSSVGKLVGTQHEDAPAFVLLGSSDGSRPLIEPRHRYDATRVRLDAEALNLQRGTFDLADRRMQFDRDAMALPYSLIESVAYDGSALVIETTRRDRFVTEAAAEPTELLRALRSRIDD